MKHFYLLNLGLFFSYVVFSQSTLSPYSSDYLEFYNQKINGTYSDVTEDGHKMGYVPLPFNLNYNYLDTAKLFKNSLKGTGSSLPSRYDLRELGMVTSIKNQGSGASGGNCWSFATMGAIESQWLKMGLPKYDLSEQNLITCHGFKWGYGEGGNDMLAMAYLTRLYGPVAETDDPYQPNDLNQRFCERNHPVVAYVPEARWLPNNIQVLKRAIMTYGGVSTSMHWTNSAYQSNNYSFFYSGNKIVNHAVMLVGWDDNYPTPVGKGAWIVRNQWDSTWADKGYFYISYYDKKINSTASYYPSRKLVSSIDKIYYYDTLSTIRLTGFRTSTAYGLTKFIANGTEALTMAGTFIQSAGTLIDVEVYDEFVHDTLKQLRNKITNYYCDLPGWYTFDIPCQVTDDFYIKIKYYSPGNDNPLPIEIVADTSFANPHIMNVDGLVNKSITSVFHTWLKMSFPRIFFPEKNSTNIPVDIPFSVSFSEIADSVSFAGISIVDSLENPVSGISTRYIRSESKIIIYHDVLQHNTLYKIKVPAGVLRSIDGVNNDSFDWSFRTRSAGLKPAVFRPNQWSLIPSEDSSLLVEFTDPVTILDTTKIHIFNGVTPLSGIKVTLDESKRVLTVKQNSLKFNTAYTLTFSPATVRSDSTALLNDSLTINFTVLPRPDSTYTWPRNRSKDVPLNTPIRVYFNTIIDSVDFSKIIIRKNVSGLPVFDTCTAILDRSNNALEIFHKKPFSYGVNYLIIIPANTVKNKQGIGNKIFYWSVTTLAKGHMALEGLTPGYNIPLKKLDSLIVITLPEGSKALNPGKITIKDESNNLVGGVMPVVSDDGRTITIQHNPFFAWKTYTITIPDSVFCSLGFNWISEDAKNWIPVGNGQKGYEYDLCIRAYTDTSSGPVPAFTTNKREACKNSPVTFTDQSIGVISSWEWDFGSGASPATLTGKGPHTVTYSSEGVKTVKLVVSGPGGTDSVVKFAYIRVTNGLGVYIAGDRIEIPFGKSDTLKAFGADTLYWMPTYSLDTTRGPNVVVTPQSLGTYVYYVYGIDGTCNGYDSIFVDVTLRPSNDNVCDAKEIFGGVNGPFNNKNAGVQPGEPHAPNTCNPGDDCCNTQYSWCFEYNAPILKNSLWFKYKVPASRKLSISTADPYNKNKEIDCQIALYRADTCIDLFDNAKYKLIAANDDFFDEKHRYAAAIQLIDTLTAGKYYFIQVDGSAGGDAGDFYITLSEFPVGNSDILMAQNMPDIYPNPTPGNTLIRWTTEMPADVNIEVYTGQGVKVYEKQVKNITVLNETVNFAAWPAGVYLVRISSGEKYFTNLIVRQ